MLRNKLLTVKEAAQLLRVSTATVYQLVAACQLRHTRVGLGRGKIMVPEDAVEDYVKNREVEAGRNSRPEPTAPTRRSRVVFKHRR